MGKQLAVTVNAVHRVGSKMYLTTGGVHRKVKKAYLTDGGVHKLCYKEGGSIVDVMTISYTGTMQDAGIVSMADGEYRLLTLTTSGTLTVDADVTAEVWMCGGGRNGQSGYDGGNDYSLGMGGTGAYTATGVLTLSGDMVAIVGAVESNSAFGGLVTAQSTCYKGGTGGGAAHEYYSSAYFSYGDGVSKYPFLDSTYFKYPHCGGGGGGATGYSPSSNMIDGNMGGRGGTNGGDGSIASRYGTTTYIPGGNGGNYGGGNGGGISCLTGRPSASAGSNASYYGSGGGGGGYVDDEETGIGQIGNGGKGYQGVIYIRIPVNQ